MINKTVILSINKACSMLFLTVLCFVQIQGLNAQSNYARGEELYMHNKPSEAAVFLERALAEDPANIRTFLYLGVVYEQLGRANEAITVYLQILPRAGNMSANVASNLGNVYFKRGSTEDAEKYYTQAIDYNSRYSQAFLGRANTKIKAGKLLEAIDDYELYLTLEPSSPQRQNIESLVNLIQSEIAAEEMRRILAADQERRLAEERQRLLDSVSASLQSAADSSQAVSSGAESVEHYRGEFELE
ncbi:MAG: tetratricopeptide repeat protein [Treponema sp.]|nr:tetratricopeptide repeat protein [Treponema sp.]MCL2251136.1 tetratricopeptide repeat protein [Treponema sp.]